jgi:hypothetical protein
MDIILNSERCLELDGKALLSSKSLFLHPLEAFTTGEDFLDLKPRAVVDGLVPCSSSTSNEYPVCIPDEFKLWEDFEPKALSFRFSSNRRVVRWGEFPEPFEVDIRDHFRNQVCLLMNSLMKDYDMPLKFGSSTSERDEIAT